MSDTGLSEWLRELVRTTDGQTAHDAAHTTAETLPIGRQIAWGLWNEMTSTTDRARTRNSFRQYLRESWKMSDRQAESLRRRLSDLTRVRTHQNPLLQLLVETGDRYDHGAILALTERGAKVLKDPKLMSGCWNQIVNPNARRKKRKHLQLNSEQPGGGRGDEADRTDQLHGRLDDGEK